MLHVMCTSLNTLKIITHYVVIYYIFDLTLDTYSPNQTTIGASLPIRTTLQDILYSGDAVHSIVGLMSVSVGSVVTDMCENKLSFTEALQRTHTTGLFEDDVFKDLEGTEAGDTTN